MMDSFKGSVKLLNLGCYEGCWRSWKGLEGF